MIPPIVTVYAITQLWGRYVTPLDLGLFLGMYLVTGLGITIGFHRLLTHRSFETNPVFNGAAIDFRQHGIAGQIVWVDKFWPLWVALGFAIPFAIGGWNGLLWGGLVRLFFVHHSTWSVNSVCHTFGARPWSTDDASRNNWWIGFLALGEGWHNNHHAFPRAAFHGMKWWQFDLSAYCIRALEALGLVWSVQRVSKEQASKRSGALE